MATPAGPQGLQAPGTAPGPAMPGGMHRRCHVLLPTSQWERRLLGVVVVLLDEFLPQKMHQQVNPSLGRARRPVGAEQGGLWGLSKAACGG